jgi:hypothetical protein
MNLTIKDLSASADLDQAAKAAVRGGNNGTANVDTLLQQMGISAPIGILNGPGSASNNFIDVSGSQDATQETNQHAGDMFFALLGRVLG